MTFEITYVSAAQLQLSAGELQTLIDIVGRTNNSEDPGSQALYYVLQDALTALLKEDEDILGEIE